jgi:hypothetical protein
MSQTDKLQILYGSIGSYIGSVVARSRHRYDISFYMAGYVPANPQAALPPLNLEDGPQGVADNVFQVG